MDDFRSKSYGGGRMQMETYYSRNTNVDGAGGGVVEGLPASGSNGYGGGLQDMRCYSASYATSAASQPPPPPMPRELKKGKSTNASGGGGAWCFSDPELQRKKRVAGYKVYTVEGKMKGSFRKSFRWVKDRYSQMIHGWR